MERLPARDMYDLIHFYFEDEAVGDEEVIGARESMRTELYGRLYEKAYIWGKGGKPEKEFGTQEVGADPMSGEPLLTHKDYVPPTPFDPTSARPYGTILDPPLE